MTDTINTDTTPDDATAAAGEKTVLESAAAQAVPGVDMDGLLDDVVRKRSAPSSPSRPKRSPPKRSGRS